MKTGMIIAIILALFFACTQRTESSQNNDHSNRVEDSSYTDSSSESTVDFERDHERSAMDKTDNQTEKPNEDSQKPEPSSEKKVVSSVKEKPSEKRTPPDVDPPSTSVIAEDTQSVIKDVPENEETERPVSEPEASVNVHDGFHQLLQEHVNSKGNVDYAAFKKNESKLDVYLDQLEGNPPSGAERSKAMAYWINAYNAYTIKLILDNYPLQSIMNLANGKVWDKKWIEIGGKSLSLNDIEHTILRKEYGDARIHFAVNCAAASCPPLWNKAWTEENLETALESRTREFINDDAYNQISASSVRVSKIFDWYKDDFGNLIAYLNKYADVEIRSNASISFNDYDWSLNAQ